MNVPLNLLGLDNSLSFLPVNSLLLLAQAV